MEEIYRRVAVAPIGAARDIDAEDVVGRGQILIPISSAVCANSRMAAGSPPTATSIKGSATPSFISTFLPSRWHSLSERRKPRADSYTSAEQRAISESPDENRSFCCCTRRRLAICRDRFPGGQCVHRRMG